METTSKDNYSAAFPVSFRDSKLHDSPDAQTEKSVELFAVHPDALGTLSALQVADELAPQLEVLVVFTDMAGTLSALKMAEGLAQKLGAHIRLLLPYQVPYALPLTEPPVPVKFLEGQIRDLARDLRLDVAAQVFLCRDKKRALALLLRPYSLVVVGGRQRWWPTPAQKLAQAIQKYGHHVIFAGSK